MVRFFEYKFVRLEGREREDYQEVLLEYTREGWRLVQIFAPGASGMWARADFFELVLERPLEEGG